MYISGVEISEQLRPIIIVALFILSIVGLCFMVYGCLFFYKAGIVCELLKKYLNKNGIEDEE